MRCVLDKEQIAVVIQKLLCYRRMENMNFESINTILANSGNYYKTNNSSKIDNIKRQFDNNFKRMNEYNDTSILVYDKNLEKYIMTAKGVVESFEDII